MSSPYQAQSRAFRNCKWCHGGGCTFCPGEARKYEEAMMQPIFTARLDNEEEMADLKEVFSVPALEKAFGPDGGGVREVELNAAVKMLTRHLRSATRSESESDDGEREK